MADRGVALVVTCEHGGHRVPPAWRRVLAPARALLATHRGFDAGALALARRIARELAAPLIAADVTRLLVDLNRHEGNPGVFSAFTRSLPAAERAAILAAWHRPHRLRVRRTIERALARGRAVLHLAIHSFTPVLDGVERNADVGLLYDPARAPELAWARTLRTALGERAAALRVRSNYPYRGVSDGLTRWLRTEFDTVRYAGIEIEINQALVRGRGWSRVQAAVVASVREALAAHGTRRATNTSASRPSSVSLPVT